MSTFKELEKMLSTRTHQPTRIFSRRIGDRAHRSGIPCIFAFDGSG